MVLRIIDGTGAPQNLSTTLDTLGNLVGASAMTDPNTGAKATVQAFHSADGQALGSGVGIYTGGVEVVFNGSTYDRSRSAPGNLGSMLVSSDNAKATYRYGSVGNTPAATPTDVFTIVGSGTKTIRIKSIKLNGVATANGNMPVLLIRRTTLDTTGTKTNPTPVPLDNTNDGAATATLALYTANPGALGTVVGTNGVIAAARLFLCTTATGSPVPTVFDFCTRQDKAVILRGTTDTLAVNLNGAAVPAGGLFDIEVEWEEDNS